MIQRRGSGRTQTILIGPNSVRNIGQRKLLISKDVRDSKFRYDLDGIRFVESPDESHTDIRWVCGKRGELVGVLCEGLVGVK